MCVRDACLMVAIEQGGVTGCRRAAQHFGLGLRLLLICGLWPRAARSSVSASPRYAVIVAGHLRSANDTIENIDRFVVQHNKHPVDVFYHLWINRSDACHMHTVDTLRGFATDVTFEDVQCSWQFGSTMANQWHGVTHATQRLIEHERISGVSYTLILKSRSDILFTEPFDFDAFADAEKSCVSSNEWIVLGDCLTGLDMVIVGTSSLMKRYAGEDVMHSEGSFNFFVINRAARLGAVFVNTTCKPFGACPSHGPKPSMSKPLTALDTDRIDEASDMTFSGHRVHNFF